MQRRSYIYLIISALLAVLISWNTVSVSLISSSPDIAFALRPESELVLARKARLSFPTTSADKFALDRKSFARTEEFAKLAVEATPYTPKAAGILAFAYALTGRYDRAQSIADSSRDIGRRDELLYISRLMIAARQREPGSVISQLDGLSRIQKNPDETLFPLLLQLLGDEAFFPSIVDLFARGPLWRSRFFVVAAQDRRNAPSLARLIDALSERGVKLSTDDLATFFIVNARNLPAADQLQRWNRYFGARTNPGATAIRDAGFNAISGPPPYSWTFGDGSNAKGWLEPKPGQANNRQAVIVSDGTERRLLLSQYLTADEGYWKFAIDGSIKGPQFQEIRINIRCLPSEERIADASFVLSPQRSRIQVDFSVSSTCVQQELQIFSEESSGSEAFEAQFDDAEMSQPS